MEDLNNEIGIKQFIEDAPVAINFINNSGKIIYANKAELRMIGISCENYIGRSLSHFYSDENKNEDLLNKILQNKSIINEECILKTIDGSEVNVLISSQEYLVENKFPCKMLISRDITKLKKVEKLSKILKKASEELTNTHDKEEALNKILVFIVPDFADWFTIDLLSWDGKIELAKMTHSDPEKIAWAKKYREINPTDLNDPTEGSVSWVIRTGQTSFYPEISDQLLELVAKSKEEFEVLKNLSLRSAITVPIKSDDKIIGVVSFISTKENKFYDQVDLDFAKDFTNRIALTLANSKLYENIRKDISDKIEANKQKDDFLAIASHELKTPLTSVKGYIHILSSLIRKGEELASLNILKKTERQINKMTKLIHNFLDISRLESSKLVIEPEEFDLNELVSETINYFNLPENKERLRFITGDIPKVYADRSKIGQVIDNYLSNALKYSASDKLVQLSTSLENNEIIVAVRDMGIGIDEVSKKKIFQRFYRAENMKNATASGFGIGLYLSIEIIKLHNGRAWFESTEGEGSTFYFSLPTTG